MNKKKRPLTKAARERKRQFTLFLSGIIYELFKEGNIEGVIYRDRLLSKLKDLGRRGGLGNSNPDDVIHLLIVHGYLIRRDYDNLSYYIFKYKSHAQKFRREHPKDCY